MISTINDINIALSLGRLDNFSILRRKWVNAFTKEPELGNRLPRSWTSKRVLKKLLRELMLWFQNCLSAFIDAPMTSSERKVFAALSLKFRSLKTFVNSRRIICASSFEFVNIR